jgi:hypothetical protein
MATKKPADDTPAADAPTTELAEAAPTAPAEHLETAAPAAAPSDSAAAVADPTLVYGPKRGRRIALIATGAVIAAALLFGGGVAVGIAIPTGGPGFSQQGGPGQGGFPGGGEQGGGQHGDGSQGERPTMPGNGSGSGNGSGQGSTDGNTDDTQSEEG